MDLQSLFSLKGKTAVITGGSGDLGLAIAEALGAAGANLVLAARDPGKLETAAKRLPFPALQVLTVPTDASRLDQAEALMDAAMERFGRIDTLVTAAGVQARMPAIDFTEEAWNRVLQANLNGTFFCAQAAAKHMIPQKSGRIIMISSLTAEIGIPNIAAYAASRGGIKQICKTLAVEWAHHGVTVNCLGPGRFRTAMTEDVFKDPVKSAGFMRLIPMGRPGVPSDLAGAAVFLASDASSYMTGQSLYLDGGWLAGGGNALG